MFFASALTMANAEDWSDFGDLDSVWDGQKTVTNKEFDDVVNALEEKKNKKEEKKKKKKIKKLVGGGKSLHSEVNPSLNDNAEISLKPKEDGVLVNVPVELWINNKTLEKGYYKVLAERAKDGKIIIKLYQSQFLKAEFFAIETEDDFEQKKVDFAELLPHNDSYMKLIFGSIDFNAFAYIPYMDDGVR